MNPPSGAPDGGFSHPGGPGPDGEEGPGGDDTGGAVAATREAARGSTRSSPRTSIRDSTRGSPRRRGDPRPRLGRLGETIASLHLVATGARILARRRRTPAGEVDIVAFERRSRTLLVVEVKTRRDDRPLELRGEQMRRLARAAEWLHARATPRWGVQCGVRIDLIDVRLPRRWWPWPRPFPRLRRIRAAWGEGGRR